MLAGECRRVNKGLLAVIQRAWQEGGGLADMPRRITQDDEEEATRLAGGQSVYNLKSTQIEIACW